MKLDWKTLAASKRASILQAIPARWRLDSIPTVEEHRNVTGQYMLQHLTNKEIEITETDVVGLAERTTSGTWTAVEVTEAFCHRAALAHQLLNCLHEVLFQAALDTAKELDAYFQRHGRPLGPLHGVPISLKDQFHIRDVATTMGYVGWIDTIEGTKLDESVNYRTHPESELVRELRALGAVLYCKTSVPHTLLTGETVNNIIGTTMHPYNRTLIPGGSSGGEGALISFHGSPGGFGTDIGGSVRGPAALCGLFGLRPSCGRLPYEGMANSLDGQNTVLSTLGPLATTARSLTFLMRHVLSQSPWLYDPLSIHMPFREDLYQSTKAKLYHTSTSDANPDFTFAMLQVDTEVLAHPPIYNALERIKIALKQKSFEVLPWKPTPSHKDLRGIAIKAYTYDGGRDVHAAFALSGEPMSSAIYQDWGDDLFAESTATQIAANNVRKRKLSKQYLDYWNSTSQSTKSGSPVDILLCPVSPFTAPRPGENDYFGYMTWVNVLDLTAAVLPMGFADRERDVWPPGLRKGEYSPMNERDQMIHDRYDPDQSHGLPVAIQVIGRRFEEEKVLATVEYLEDLLKGD